MPGFRANHADKCDPHLFRSSRFAKCLEAFVAAAARRPSREKLKCAGEPPALHSFPSLRISHPLSPFSVRHGWSNQASFVLISSLMMANRAYKLALYLALWTFIGL